MRLQPNRNYVSNDCVQTPPELAARIVAHLRPTGRMLEPCAGEGNFLRALRAHARLASLDRAPPATALSATARSASVVSWCELEKGRDFFAWDRPVDWIVTNPPWSQLRRFLQHAMSLSAHVVFLVTINHVWTRARIRDIRAAGFGIRQMVLVDTPASFPPMGFQLGVVHLARGWRGPIALVDWTEDEASRAGSSSKFKLKSKAIDDVDVPAREHRALGFNQDLPLQLGMSVEERRLRKQIPRLLGRER